MKSQRLLDRKNKLRQKVKKDYELLIEIGSSITDAIDDLAIKYGVCFSTIRNYLK